MSGLHEPFVGYAIVAVVALQRASELLLDRRNRRELVREGGVVVGGDATPVMIAFHCAWFAALVGERWFLGARMPRPDVAAGTAAALAMVVALRAWVFATLGRRWTMRVVVVPGEAPVRRGPYRFLAHPNYAVVCAEVLLVAVLVGAWRTALVGSILHLPVLARRIRREERAWRELGRESLGRVPAPPVPRPSPAPRS